MNRKQAKKLAPIITAFGDGECVQSEDACGGWHEECATDPNFENKDCGESLGWRIKPEPRVIYVNIYKSGGYGAHNTAETASGAASAAVAECAVKFIEVLEDE